MIIIDLINKLQEENTENIKLVFTLNTKKLINIILLQQEKGLKKYGQTIDNCPFDKYNWEDMFYEEIADALVYLEKKHNKEKNEY